MPPSRLAALPRQLPSTPSCRQQINIQFPPQRYRPLVQRRERGGTALLTVFNWDRAGASIPMRSAGRARVSPAPCHRRAPTLETLRILRIEYGNTFRAGLR
jgi:hypothetical protein